jgi:hypothetical protein
MGWRIKTQELDMRSIKILKVMGLIAAVALTFAACNQVTSGELGEEGSDPAASILNLGQNGVGANPANWTVIINPPFVSLGITTINGVTSDGSTIVAVAGTGNPGTAYAATSTGGINWGTPTALPSALSRSPSVANYLGGNFLVTAGNTATDGAYSPDHLRWSKTGPADPAIGIGFGTKASAYGQDTNTNTLVYVVAGQNGRAAYTDNLGNSFKQIPQTITGWSGTGSDAYINTGAYGQGSDGETELFVFGGGSARIAYTDTIPLNPNDTEWRTANQTAFTGRDFINVIAFGNGTFVAVGGPGNLGEAAYSTDGINWTTVANFPLGQGFDVYALAYGYGPQGQACFVAGDDAGYIAYSYTGGATWTLANQQPVLKGPVNAITYDTASNRFIAVGGTGAPQVAYTP